MEEKRKSEKAPLIYAIVGVAVLIVAVAGSTFAFFTASATADTPIQGETLNIDLGVTVRKVSGTGTKGAGLIPIHDGTTVNAETSTNYDSQLQSAASATTSCVDKNNYTTCQIYEITLTNGGTDATTVDTTIEFDATVFTKVEGEADGYYEHLKWAPMTGATQMGTGTFAASTMPGEIFSDVTLGSTPVVQYVMVYVNNTGDDQTSEDFGSFNGTIKVTAATGAQVQAQF